MKILVSPDSFKGSLTSSEVCYFIERGIKKVDEKIEVIKIPMADGGEGTVDALISATGGKIIKTVVHDPLMREINAFFGLLGDGTTAVIEMSAASGITLLDPSEKNPMETTTYGTGELIIAALDLGCRNIIIGVGGSSTNDGGMGMAKALGVNFLDEAGYDIGLGGGCLKNLVRIDTNKLDYRINECNIVVACDVDNPLCGPLGASYIFGPQKGATSDMVKILDANLKHYGEIVEKTTNIPIIYNKGSGAAGGLAGGLLAFLRAKLKKGVDIVIETTLLEEKIKNVDFVLTGEGMIDYQTAFGKTALGVAQIAELHGIPVIAVCGAIGIGTHELYSKGFTSIFSITDKPMTLDESIKNSGILLENLAENITRLFIQSNK